jgi:hypothetical protein
MFPKRLPPSADGEWWELTDDSRGLPYYYQTKTGETVWERPEGFVIPLGIIQVRHLVAHHCNYQSVATIRIPRWGAAYRPTSWHNLGIRLLPC